MKLFSEIPWRGGGTQRDCFVVEWTRCRDRWPLILTVDFWPSWLLVNLLVLDNRQRFDLECFIRWRTSLVTVQALVYSTPIARRVFTILCRTLGVICACCLCVSCCYVCMKDHGRAHGKCRGVLRLWFGP